VLAHDPQPSMVITQKIIATGKLFTTNIEKLRSLEPVQEGELYLEYNGVARPDAEKQKNLFSRR
jgi:hypothetical protein